MVQQAIYSHDKRDELATPLCGTYRLDAFKKNTLLAPTLLGTVKTSYHDLPSDNGNLQHEYGLRQERDGITSNDVLGHWEAFEGTTDLQPPRDFKALNKNAVIAGCKDATTMQKYRNSHDFRVKVASDSVIIKPAYDQNTVFGRRTGASEVFADIISHQCRFDWASSKPKASELQETLKAKKPAQTKTSKLYAQSAKAKMAEPEVKKPWKMSSFANVPAKLGPTG
jgi:hypothetical protein